MELFNCEKYFLDGHWTNPYQTNEVLLFNHAFDLFYNGLNWAIEIDFNLIFRLFFLKLLILLPLLFVFHFCLRMIFPFIRLFFLVLDFFAVIFKRFFLFFFFLRFSYNPSTSAHGFYPPFFNHFSLPSYPLFGCPFCWPLHSSPFWALFAGDRPRSEVEAEY